MSEQGTVKDLTVVDPTGTGEAPVSREEMSTLYSELNPLRKRQLIDLAAFLSASSDARQREQYLNQLLREI